MISSLLFHLPPLKTDIIRKPHPPESLSASLFIQQCLPRSQVFSRQNPPPDCVTNYRIFHVKSLLQMTSFLDLMTHRTQHKTLFPSVMDRANVEKQL